MSAGGYALQGRVVTMDGASRVLDDGRVYVAGERIVAVLPAGAPAPEGFPAGAGVIRTGGTIYPGLIELHSHLAYNVLPLWRTPRRYSNRGQWGGILDYRRRVSGPMGVLGKVAGYIEAVVRYAEAKCLLGGVTTSQGIALYSNAGARRYYHGLVRNVEQPRATDLPRADTRIADVEAASAGGFLQRLESSSCLLLHLSEGVDDVARAHFRALQVDGRQWAITPALAGIHCAGLRGRDFATLRSRGGSIVWSPLSNLLLYGATADIARAVREHVTLALGSDWSPSGSKNLLCELKVAWLVAGELDAGLSARDLVAAATTNAARILKWDGALGSIEPGKRADLVVVGGLRGDPYEHLLRARETSITLVVIDGRPRYGQPRLMRRFGLTAEGGEAEAVTVGSSSRWLDLTGDVADPIIGALSLGEARDRLADGLAKLPELAARMEQTGAGAALLGTTSASPDEPGRWFLELDHEPLPGFLPRPQLPFGGVPTGVYPDFVLAAPLSEILEPLELDPLTIAGDPRFFDRLAESATLPEYLVRELPKLYGQRPRTPAARDAEAGEVPAAAGAEEPVRLADYLPRERGGLTAEEQRLLVEQAMVLLGESYVHLEHKRSMHAVEPIQRLRLLRYKLSQAGRDGAAGTLGDLAFHREMTSVFTAVRDLHTNYLLPAPWRDMTAFLPFLVEEYFDDGAPRYVVTHVAPGYSEPGFEVGVEVLHWNGTAISRAIAVEADRQAGSNDAARWAQGLDALTIRPLVRSLPPDEDWVTISYRALDRSVRETRWDWLVWAPPIGGGVDPDGTGAVGAATALGYDLQTDLVNQVRKVLFARRAFELETEVAAAAGEQAEPVAVAVGEDLPTTMPAVFRAREVQTASGTFGYVRIFTFNVANAEPFVAEFVRLAGALPASGLILDVRGNGGGLILAAEELLQVLTPRPITPSRAQFMTTPLMLDLCERHAPSRLDPTFDLTPWLRSMRQAVTTGARYSQAQPITGADAANAIGQRYQGPVVLVTDALCYSATDMFAAGFADHGIGTILGVAANTGAGGANVWTHELLRALMDTPHPGEPRVAANPFRKLPRGAGMRVSVRRTTRVGALDGMPLEDLGVEPGERHFMSREDVLGGNRDLIEHAGRLLAGAPVHRLEFEVALGKDGAIVLDVTAKGVERVDVWVDGRPADSFEIDGRATRELRSPVGDPTEVECRGLLGGRTVARAVRAV
jgi:cytosine/adenosine deaminase-related metal-dependent hydrolase